MAEAMFGCDRIWLLTWTCYGEWVPGDARGFVGRVRDLRPGELSDSRLRHNCVQTEYDQGIEGLARRSRARMKGSPVRLDGEQARVLMSQLLETARHRGWRVLAAAVMAQHVHLLVGVPDDPDPDSLLRDFKSYGSRALNRTGRGARERWWTRGGSTRKKGDRAAILTAAAYVRDQTGVLAAHLEPDVAGVIEPPGDGLKGRDPSVTGG